ncbi:hypothetical protein BBJ28_00021436 [Nothophytophthora sp. Chile5]|nr:hypothetical protein BBJ28_00021436 [Nothophytophthora sp. Chile5]
MLVNAFPHKDNDPPRRSAALRSVSNDGYDVSLPPPPLHHPTLTRVLAALSVLIAKPRPSPTLFCFPGLESAPWHDTSKFAWVQQLEANREVITNEYLALRKQRDDLAQAAAPDATAASDYKVYDKEHQLHQGQWDWLSYVTQGRRQADFAVQCPKTVEILESIPGFMADLPFAYSFFSILKPEAHSAPCNIRLRCHFPLFVPEGCGIRVGDETRQWEEGKALVLDGKTRRLLPANPSRKF